MNEALAKRIAAYVESSAWVWRYHNFKAKSQDWTKESAEAFELMLAADILNLADKAQKEEATI